MGVSGFKFKQIQIKFNKNQRFLLFHSRRTVLQFLTKTFSESLDRAITIIIREAFVKLKTLLLLIVCIATAALFVRYHTNATRRKCQCLQRKLYLVE
jgi:uncharacterized membrane protein